MNMTDVKMMVLVDSAQNQSTALENPLMEVCTHGATMLVYRDNLISEKAQAVDFDLVKEACRAHGIPFIITGEMTAEKLAQADGYHCEGSIAEAGDMRAKLGSEKIIGVTVRSADEAKMAETLGLDYCGFVVSTLPSSDVFEPTSLQELHRVSQAVKLPVIAVQSVTEQNIALLAGTGVSGVFVAKGLLDAEKPATAMRWLTRKFDTVQRGGAQVDGVLLDCDGTLTDTRLSVYELAPRYLSDNGYLPGKDLPEIIADKSFSEAAGYVKHNYSVRDGVADIVEEWRYMLYDAYKTAHPKAGVKMFLQALKTLGIPAFAVSAHDAKLMDHLLQMTSLKPLLTGNFSGWASRFSGTESAYFVEAAALVLANEKEKWAFDDRLSALEAAATAGLRTAAIHDDLLSRREWERMIHMADVAFMDFDSAASWLQAAK